MINCDIEKGNEFPFKGEYIDVVTMLAVLEHVEKPWELATFVESKVKTGGRIILTVPYGPWEAIGLYDTKKYFWRAHVWHMVNHLSSKEPRLAFVDLTFGHGFSAADFTQAALKRAR